MGRQVKNMVPIGMVIEMRGLMEGLEDLKG